LIPRVKELGLDFIEIPLMCLETYHAEKVRAGLVKYELDACASTVLLGNTDITSKDPEIRKKGIKYLKSCIDACIDTGIKQFSGVIYSEHVKQVSGRPQALDWDYSADSLREVARYANKSSIKIGLEPVNRYETYLVNTCEQALRLKKMIGEDNVGIHLDSYHMNIEEKNFYNATKLAGSDLMHYHFCENDRGIPGTGLVDWNGIFKALKDINYTGYAALESFIDCTGNMNTWVWRQLAESGDDLVKKGLSFIRDMIKKYNLNRHA
ncbi:MAG TPA: hypothetical protein DC049_19825, partial [Spirochaetia bacterium]|nr:hypothetical protein [Spirochaetia bacterium]